MAEQQYQKRPLPQEKEPETKELSIGNWMLKGSVALFFDTTGALINLLPVAGQILEEFNDLFADGVFLLWFTLDGVKYSKNTMFGSFVLKFIPILNMLPEYTLMIIIMYMKSKKDAAVRKTVGGGSIARTIANQNKSPNA